MTSRRAARRTGAERLGLPLAAQIIVLLVAVLVVGQLATLAVVIVLPPPRPPIYRLEEAALALKGAPIRPRTAPPLLVETVTGPPESGSDPRSQQMRSQLARILDAPEAQVALKISGPPLLSFPFGSARPRGRWEHRRRLRFDGAYDGPPRGDDAPFSRPGIDGRAADRSAVLIGGFAAGYERAPGRWTVVRSPDEHFPNDWQTRMLFWFLACLLILTPLGYVFAQRLTAPLRAFARAADRLGRDPHAPALAVTGPAEIGAAARALNEMQARLARYVEDRTAMIAAIAHDLRTPLARAEFKLRKLPEAAAEDVRGDLAQMEAMISAVLAFVRDAAPGAERAKLDLRSLLEVVCDDAVDTGGAVSLDPGEDAVVVADASALQRLFVNLVDNALKYGSRAKIVLKRTRGEAVVRVEDEGPGVPKTALEDVFEPFRRLETSRNRGTGGIGLGLSVARSIARSHGGEVHLENRLGGGLAAVVRLPCEQEIDSPEAPPSTTISHTEDINV